MNIGIVATIVLILTFLVIGADKAGVIHLRHEAPPAAAKS